MSSPKHPSGPLNDRYKYQIFEDLTSVAFKKMRSMTGLPPVGQRAASSAIAFTTTQPSRKLQMSSIRLTKSLANPFAIYSYAAISISCILFFQTVTHTHTH
jgi:hypothetical protein